MLAAGNSPLFVHLWFALRWIGAIQVPLHAQATAAATAQVIEDCGATHAIGDTAGIARVRGFRRAGPGPADRVRGLGGARGHRRRARPARARGLGADGAVVHPLHLRHHRPRPRACGCPTTASSPPPASSPRRSAITEEDRVLLALPLFHTNPQVYGVLVALTTGCSLAVIERFDGGDVHAGRRPARGHGLHVHRHPAVEADQARGADRGPPPAVLLGRRHVRGGLAGGRGALRHHRPRDVRHDRDRWLGDVQPLRRTASRLLRYGAVGPDAGDRRRGRHPARAPTPSARSWSATTSPPSCSRATTTGPS